MKLFTKSMDPDTSLGVAERTSYMIGNIGTALINTIIASFLLFFYTDVVHLNAVTIGSIMLASRIFDGLSDVIMGLIVDRTHSRHGRARVWVLRMCIPYAISGILLMFVPTGSAETIQYIYVFITYNLCNAIFLTALYVPYNSMTVNMTANPYERGLLSIFVMSGAVIGTLLTQSTVDAATKALGGGQRAWQIVIAVYAVVGCLMHLICFFGTKERCLPAVAEGHKVDIKKELASLFTNPYWIIAVIVAFFALFCTGMMNGSGMYYAKAAFGDTEHYATFANAMSIAQAVGLIFSFTLIKPLGKRNMALIGMAGAGVASILPAFVSTSLTAVAVLCGARGFLFGIAAAVFYGIVADTIDYGEWKTGMKAEGVGMAAMTMSTKLANGFSLVVVGWLVEQGGYNGELAVQPESAVNAVSAGFNWIPAACCLICALLLCFYKLDKIYPKIQADLQERRKAEAK